MKKITFLLTLMLVSVAVQAQKMKVFTHEAAKFTMLIPADAEVEEDEYGDYIIENEDFLVFLDFLEEEDYEDISVIAKREGLKASSKEYEGETFTSEYATGVIVDKYSKNKDKVLYFAANFKSNDDDDNFVNMDVTVYDITEKNRKILGEMFNSIEFQDEVDFTSFLKKSDSDKVKAVQQTVKEVSNSGTKGLGGALFSLADKVLEATPVGGAWKLVKSFF